MAGTDSEGRKEDAITAGEQTTTASAGATADPSTVRSAVRGTGFGFGIYLLVTIAQGFAEFVFPGPGRPWAYMLAEGFAVGEALVFVALLGLVIGVLTDARPLATALWVGLGVGCAQFLVSSLAFAPLVFDGRFGAILGDAPGVVAMDLFGIGLIQALIVVCASGAGWVYGR